jgi:hypothetical protein
MAMRSMSSPRAGNIKTRQLASAAAKREKIMASSLPGFRDRIRRGIPCVIYLAKNMPVEPMMDCRVKPQQAGNDVG